jgi:nucleoside-diphosphate-sugar epimerase
VATEKPLTIWKQNYNHVRPYLGINDAVNSIIFFINSTDDCWNDTYNVLTSNYSLCDIIEIIRDIEKNVTIKFIDTPLKNQYSYKVSNKKIKKLGYSFKDNMHESIKQTLQLLGHEC